MQKTALPDTPVLDIVDVSKVYEQWQRTGRARDIFRNLLHPQKRQVRALDHLSLRVEPGEFVAYAGANGAGKSTTIKILSGILAPSAGRVTVLGRDPQRERVALMREIGVLFGQRTELWWDHSVRTSFAWKKQVWDIPDAVYARNLAMVTELLELGDILDTFARELSLGQRMRADLGMLLLHGPRLLFLDEPTLGLDVLAKRRMIEFLRHINREDGTTIVVTSHDMDDLEEMARRIILLSDGRIAYDGDFAHLRDVQDSMCRIVVTTGRPEPPRFAQLQYMDSQGCTHTYQFDKKQVSVRQVLAALARAEDVLDVEIQKAPIEQLVANLYMQWSGTPQAAQPAG